MCLGSSTDQKMTYISPQLHCLCVTCFDCWADLTQAKPYKEALQWFYFCPWYLWLLGEHAEASPVEDEKHMTPWPQLPQSTPITARLVGEWTQLRTEEPPSWVHLRAASPWDYEISSANGRTAQTSPALTAIMQTHRLTKYQLFSVTEFPGGLLHTLLWQYINDTRAKSKNYIVIIKVRCKP